MAMEWGQKEDRVAVIALHKCGHSASTIFKLLQKLGISRSFVFRTIKRWKDVQSVDDSKRSGRPRSVCTPAAIQRVRSRINRNPVRKQKVMALQMSLKRGSLKSIINRHLKLRAYRRKKGHLLNNRLRTLRRLRSRVLLKRYANKAHRNILFSDEKIFTIEETYNKQNDRVYARSSTLAGKKAPRVIRGHHPSSVMVWLGASYQGMTEVHFCEKGVKTGAMVYQNTVLDKVVKPLSQTLFKNQHWVFQQDSAPAHKAKSTQQWFRENKIDFIPCGDWPSSSPDLNPLDYAIWRIIEEKACAKPHKNLDSLKKSICMVVEEIDMEAVRTAIDDWPRRLRACIKAGGGHFE